MKRLFSLIIILITLSLIGIIWLQVSWLKNMAILREDQVKQKVDMVVKHVAADFMQYKAQYADPDNNSQFNFLRPKTLTDFSRTNNIGFLLTHEQIVEKIRTAFDKEGLKDLNFEYALLLISHNSLSDAFEKWSPNYVEAAFDTVKNYKTPPFAIVTMSGTPADGLSSDEALLVVALNWKRLVMSTLTPSIILAIAFTLIILAAFYVTLYTMLRQKKLSDMKNDFINNMTHEFKTPLATISLAVDALKNEKVMADAGKMSYFSGIIKEENQRMNKQVETILKASQFEKREVDLDRKPVHVHEVILNVVDNFVLQLDEKNGQAEMKLDAPLDVIAADEVHFTNLVNNMVDNAVKYSKENVPIHLKISTANNGGKFVMRFEDNGIGMNKDTQKRVFEKFYRAHTGNLHNVKGFGLGLNYVKSVTDSHDGTVKVDSVLGRGSTFTFEFPLSKKQDTHTEQAKETNPQAVYTSV